MEIQYNITGDARKALVTAIGELGFQKSYQRRC